MSPALVWRHNASKLNVRSNTFLRLHEIRDRSIGADITCQAPCTLETLAFSGILRARHGSVRSECSRLEESMSLNFGRSVILTAGVSPSLAYTCRSDVWILGAVSLSRPGNSQKQFRVLHLLCSLATLTQFFRMSVHEQFILRILGRWIGRKLKRKLGSTPM